MNSQLMGLLELKQGANNLPYEIPMHPNLVHFTLGLFIIAIVFDIAGALFPLERPILKFLALPALRSGFFEVGWYNLVVSAAITFFTVAWGFFEAMLAKLPANAESDWGFGAKATLLLHGLGGILLLAAIVAMAVWRGLQRYRWRRNAPRQVQWSYLLVGIVLLGIMYVQGTLGAQLGDEFGIHVTAANLLENSKNPNVQLK
ncbi:MAG: hypothetical protein BRC57_03705 [Cyanobacteria bacterium QS_8_48_54]|jgi:uncharacterized membrane protein|nr:MAG: hypothetical protein BRC48_06805 [Cyanobacteria bacterium QS_9_48_30]PSP36055.1 MAG: hypothetical protein BRC57_03705 [Cyanobacteria bacterium QS_8_48_54]